MTNPITLDKACSIHPKVKLLLSLPTCDCCGLEAEEYCPVCVETAIREHKRKMLKECNVVVLLDGATEVRARRIVRTSGSTKTMLFPHGGKRVRKGSYASLNTKTGYIEKAGGKTNLFVLG